MNTELEIEIPMDMELEIEVPDAPAPSTSTLVEVLPDDVPLPTLIKFVPDLRFKIAVEQAAQRAQAVNVTGPEGLAAADVELTNLRDAIKAATEHFREPVEIAHGLHKWATSKRSEWIGVGPEVVTALGRRMYDEDRRLKKIAEDAARETQRQLDEAARAAAAKEAQSAAKAGAPATVIDRLKEQAKTATAAPVAVQPAAPKLASSSFVGTYKARIKGTPGHVDQNPKIGDLNAEQAEQVIELLKAIVAGKAPMAAIELNWSYLNGRAKADKKTFAITGFEVYEDGGARGKAARR